ncbi:Caltractin [Diplonema papillatum]|nr:Caltractin [Diplonema papillatum]
MSLSEDQIREAFDLFDADGSGEVDRTELRLVMQALGHKLTEEQLDEMIGSIDDDADQKVNFREFERMMVKRNVEKDSRAEIERAFKLFDLNHNSLVSVDNFVTIATDLGEDPDVAREKLTTYVAAASGGQDSINLEQWIEVMETVKPRMTQARV